MRWIIGKQIDNYRTVKLLGKGGMGIVLEAVDESLDMIVAMKLMDPMLSQDKNFKRRFQAEAKALARLNSNNIVRVLALRESEFGLYIVMEYVDGNTVADRIVNLGKLSWKETAPILTQLLTAISHAHENGVIHLDIKPRNIMIDQADIVKVTDFGLAKLQQVSQSTTATFNAGTITYMSPEQIRGREKVDERSDIYSIGVTVYEMLSGRTPYDKTSAFYDLQKTILKGRPPSLADFAPELPNPLVQLVMKSIHKNPGRRFQTAREMLDAIKQFEAGTLEITPPPVAEETVVFKPLQDGTFESPPTPSPEKMRPTQIFKSEEVEIKLEPGEKIFQYELDEKIRSGKNGMIFRARDTELNRDVALKFFAEDAVPNDEVRQQLIQIIRTVTDLNHPAIASVYDVCHEGKYDFLCTEWLPGNSLKKQITSGPMDLDNALGVAIQTAEALKTAHAQGIYHLVLSPSNVVILEDDRVKVLGFGISELLQHEDFLSNDILLGTFAYLAPEIASGEPGTERSDVFSLGLILLEMCSGTNPFRRKSHVETLFALVNSRLASIQKLAMEIPDSMVKIIEKALAKDPKDRYATIEDMLLHMKNLEASGEASIPSRFTGDVDPSVIDDEFSFEADSIEELFKRRERIDKLLAEQYTQNLTLMSCRFMRTKLKQPEVDDLNQRIFSLISHHNGTVGRHNDTHFLATFVTPEDGTRCAIDIMNLKSEASSQMAQYQMPVLRIGMHFGDVIVKEDDLIGRAISVVVSAEEIAGSNEILISKALQQHIDGNDEFLTDPVKNSKQVSPLRNVKLLRLLWNPHQIRQYVKTVHKQTGSVGDSAVIEPIRILLPPQISRPAAKDLRSSRERNPYLNREAIRDPEAFFGRRSEIGKIYSRVGAGRPQSVSIVGEKHIGKSSLLRYIVHPSNRLDSLSDPKQLIFLQANFKNKSRLKIPGFFEMIYKDLLEVFNGALELNVKPNYHGFKEVVVALDQQGYKLIMVFDEFSTITRNRNFDAEFYSFLRSLANNYNVAYLVASGRNLQTVCHSPEVSDSPFFNIFSNITLSQFSVKDARKLILTPAEKHGASFEPHVPFVLDMAGQHPLFIQIACSILFDRPQYAMAYDNAFYEGVKSEMAQKALPYFQEIFESLEDDKRQFLLHLAEMKPVERSQEYLLTQLTKAGYVRQHEGNNIVFSSLFADFIFQQFGIRKTRKMKFRFWRS